MTISLAPDLTLPDDAVTQTFGVLAKRRAGKSYLARRLVEQLHRTGQQVVVLDPKGDWWGLRSAADGKSPGLPIIIIGGERGDVPLEPAAGELVAKLVVEEGVSALLDLSLLRKHEIATFATAFLEALYRLKAREQYRTPLMLVIDEADAIAPQKPQPSEARMLGAAEDIVRRGGQRGIGCMLVTQRSAVLNKNVLTQVQVLVALRTIAPQDLAALGAWIDVHGTVEQRGKLMESLPSLPTGDAWFWSPGWPSVDGIFTRTHVLPIQTFDSGATPRPGEKRVEPKHLADVDLDVFRRQMAETMERAKANDPRELRARIAELEKANASKPSPFCDECSAKLPRHVEGCPKEPRRPPIRREHARLLRDLVERGQKVAVELQRSGKSLALHAEEASTIAATLEHLVNDWLAASEPGQTVQTSASPPVPPVAAAAAADVGLTRPQRRMIEALASFEAIGVAVVPRKVLAVYSDQSPRSSAYSNNLGSLRTRGFLSYPSQDNVSLTATGRALAPRTPAPASYEALHRAWLSKVSRPQRKMLSALIDKYPSFLRRDALAEASGQSLTSSAYTNNLGALRTLGVIDYPERGAVVATSLLFPIGLR